MAFKFAEKMDETFNTDNVLVVDALNVAFRWKHQGRNDFRFDYERTVKSLAQSYNCGRIIIASDKGTSSYRKNLLPIYKENRKEKREEQTEVERLAFECFFEEYLETLELLAENGMTVLRYDGVEADDIAAHLVNNSNEYNFQKVWLVSSDKDWDLLIQDSVSRFSTVTRKETTVDNWAEHYDVDPDMYLSYKCLIGDKKDNVPGVVGIGPVKAKGLIETYGDVFDIADQMPLNSKYKYIQNLNEFGSENLLLNVELLDLITYCDEAIGADNVADIKEKLIG